MKDDLPVGTTCFQKRQAASVRMARVQHVPGQRGVPANGSHCAGPGQGWLPALLQETFHSRDGLGNVRYSE